MSYIIAPVPQIRFADMDYVYKAEGHGVWAWGDTAEQAVDEWILAYRGETGYEGEIRRPRLNMRKYLTGEAGRGKTDA